MPKGTKLMLSQQMRFPTTKGEILSGKWTRDLEIDAPIVTKSTQIHMPWHTAGEG